MKINIKEISNDGKKLKGVNIQLGWREAIKLDEAGISGLLVNNVINPVDDLPDLAAVEEDAVKKEDLLKDDRKIACRTFLHKYNESKEALVKRWLAEKHIEYRKNSGITTDFIQYDLDIYQIKELYLYLSSSEGGTDVLLI